jgi:hypothetical protein
MCCGGQTHVEVFGHVLGMGGRIVVFGHGLGMVGHGLGWADMGLGWLDTRWGGRIRVWDGRTWFGVFGRRVVWWLYSVGGVGGRTWVVVGVVWSWWCWSCPVIVSKLGRRQ